LKRTIFCKLNFEIIRMPTIAIHRALQTALDHHQAGRLSDAESLYRQILTQDPNHPDALHLLGMVLIQTNRPKQAIEVIRQAINFQPNIALYHHSLGNALTDLGQVDDGNTEFREAIRLQPNYPEAHNNLGVNLKAQMHVEEAIKSFRRAIQFQSGYAAAHVNLSNSLLLLGQWKEGWAEFQWRLKLPEFRLNRDFVKPEWDGQDPSGRTILLHAEGGHGDALNFIRFAPEAKRRGANLVYSGDDGTPIALVEQNGYYVDQTTGLNYNPADPLFGGTYTLTTSDGTSYILSATTGQIQSAKDSNGNAINYTSTFGEQTPDAEGLITSISDAAGQTVQYVYDSIENLIGVVDAAGNKTTYQYGDELVVPNDSLSSSSVVAVITGSSGFWNPSTSTWVSSGTAADYAITLTGDTIASASEQNQWYFAAAPAGIAVGTKVTINYYAGGNFSAPIFTEQRTWSEDGIHEMTGIIDASGVKALTATYVNDNSGQLASLQQTNEPSSPVTTGGFDGTNDDQIVTNSAGQTTEDVYDSEGDVIRQVKTLTNASGIVTGYEVTVTNYNYVTDPGDPTDTGSTTYGMLETEVEYAPFFVAPNQSGLQDSAQPTTALEELDYDTAGDNYAGDLGQLITDTQYLADGNAQVTHYSDYVLGKPESVVVDLENSSGQIIQTTTTDSSYNSNGNLQSSTDATGVITAYTYTSGTSGVPDGLLLNTYRGLSTNTSQDILISSNNYYSATDASLGQVAGMLAFTTTYDYSSSTSTSNPTTQTTYYAYDALGDQVLSYTPKTWNTSSGSQVKGWSVTINQYNLDGQETETWQNAYVDSSTGSEIAPLNYSFTPATSGTTGTVTISEPLYVDSTQTSSTSAQPQSTSTTTYNSSGQVTSTTDQYGAATTSIYDINGNVVDTLYPDGTEVRTVYNSLGQVILQTNRYKTNTTISSSGAITFDNTTPAPVATVTLYNSLGQAYSTQEYSNVLITITADPNAPTSSGIEIATLQGAALTPQSTNFISMTQTWYDDQGRTIETENAAGLRTGTIYYSNGQVEYTGPLNASAPDGGEQTTTNGITTISFQLSDFASYTQYLYDQVDQSTGNPWSGMVYNEVIDPDGHWTKTFQDSAGRTIFTVNEDGSYTQTIYSVGSQPIPSSSLPSGVTSPSGLAIPEGGSETVTITQTSTGLAATFDIYDAAGNLTDVWQPPVADALNGGAMTSPHTHYDYDASGNEIDQIDAKDNETLCAYDENGNMISETLPDGQIETWSYTAFGQELTHTDFKGQTEAFVYDDSTTGDGRLVGEYFFASGATVFNANGTVDTANASQSTVYTYNPLGQEQTVTDDSGTTTYSYDAFGNITQEQTPEGTINYVYDPATGNHTETYTSSTEIFYGYDAQGQLTSVTVDELNGTMIQTPLVTTYTYDAAGNLISETDPDGVITTYGYDDENRLLSEVQKNASGTTLYSETNSLNPDGTIASSSELQMQSNGTTETISTVYTYDDLDRLTSETVTNSNSSQSFADSYTYDLDGNRVGKSQTTSAGTETTTNTYNGDDQLTQSVDSVTGTTTFDYDDNGSLISSTNNGTVVANYTYNVQNEMVGATVNGITSSDVYDDNGDRVEETVNGTSTYYLYDDNNPTGYDQVLESKSSPTGAPSMSYILGLNIIGQANSSGTVSYFLTDGQGSTRALVNSSGVVTATFNYDAEGNLLGVTYTPSSPPPTVYLYDQQQLDVALAQYQLRARIYNSQTGEFDSMDPMTHPADDTLGQNAYIYADDDAPNMDDPTGMGAITNALFGTAVHSFLARAFESFTPVVSGYGGTPGPRLPVGTAIAGTIQRFGNRQIRSIAKFWGSPGSANVLRPDFVEINGIAVGGKLGTGDLYELKSLSVTEALSGPAMEAAIGVSLGIYMKALNFSVPNITWSLGTTWIPGLTVWPTFTSPLLPPGSELVTWDNYAIAPGAIFYDVVSVDDAAELAGAAVAGIAAVAQLAGEIGVVSAATELAGAGLAWIGGQVSALIAQVGLQIGVDAAFGIPL
jgi:RHS repeat-associated protein